MKGDSDPFKADRDFDEDEKSEEFEPLPPDRQSVKSVKIWTPPCGIFVLLHGNFLYCATDLVGEILLMTSQKSLCWWRHEMVLGRFVEKF